jgi:hypothetical protein
MKKKCCAVKACITLKNRFVTKDSEIHYKGPEIGTMGREICRVYIL